MSPVQRLVAEGKLGGESANREVSNERGKQTRRSIL